MQTNDQDLRVLQLKNQKTEMENSYISLPCTTSKWSDMPSDPGFRFFASHLLYKTSLEPWETVLVAR